MATAAIAGYKAKLYVSTDGGNTYNLVGEVRNLTLRVEADNIDVTSHDSAGWREFIQGLKQWTATAEALYVDTNAQQDAVYAALTGGTVIDLRIYAEEASGKEQWEGEARVTSWELSGPNDDAAVVNLEFQGTGALTKGVQA